MRDARGLSGPSKVAPSRTPTPTYPLKPSIKPHSKAKGGREITVARERVGTPSPYLLRRVRFVGLDLLFPAKEALLTTNIAPKHPLFIYIIDQYIDIDQ